MAKKAKSVRIFSYGCSAPLENGDLVADQMWKRHRFHNALIEQERNRREKAHAILLRHWPQIEAAEQELVQLNEEIDAVEARIKQTSANARRRKVDPADRMELAALKLRRRECAAELKACKQAAYGVPEPVQETREALKQFEEQCDEKGIVADKQPQYATLKKEKRDAEEAWYASNVFARELHDMDVWDVDERKRLYAAWDDVYWATRLTVLDAMKKARKGAPPRFRRWDGNGCVAVQFQGGEDVANVLSGKSTLLRLEPLGISPHAQEGSKRSQRRQRMLAWFRVGSDEKGKPIWAKVRAILHRPLPEGAVLKWAKLFRRRCGTRDEWELQLTVETPRQERLVADKGAVSVSVGMCERQDGSGGAPDSLRVALWVGEDGRSGQLVIDGKERLRWQKASDLRSIRDKNFDKARECLLAWLKDASDIPDWLTEKTARLATWRSCGRLASVVLYWRNNRFGGDEEIYAAIEAWRKQDKHLWDWEAANRLRAQRWRDDLYRNFAHELSRRYQYVYVADVNLARELRKPSVEAKNDESAQDRALSRIAAIGRLREILAEAMELTKLPLASGEAVA